jgi:deazaflavin-dependent oxidoreductase (nitroreductase family)
MATRYLRPGWFTTNVFNRLVAGLTRVGISVIGSRILAVRGRKTGQWRTTPVNLLTHEGARYLVAPRGVTQWVRNVRAGCDVELRIGRRRQPVTLIEPTFAAGRWRSAPSSRAWDPRRRTPTWRGSRPATRRSGSRPARARADR